MKALLLNLSLIAPLFFSLGFGSQSQNAKRIINENPLSITSIQLNPNNLSPGAIGTLEIEVFLDEGHHAYQDQFDILIESPNGIKKAPLKIDPLVEFDDVISKKKKWGAKDKAKVTSVLELPDDLPEGRQYLKGQLVYQACTKEYCLFPKEIPFEIEFASLAALTSPGLKWSELFSSGAGQFFEQSLSQGWGFALLVVFLAGILTSFTPCIFPMIPITLAVLGARSEGRSRGSQFLLSLSYVLGIASTYSVLGLIAASTGSLFGSLLGHPAFAVFLFLLFVTLGMSMFGLFEIQAPAIIRNRMSLHKTKGGFAGAFFTGQVSGLLASPCVGPVLVAILAWVAQSQDLWAGFVLLFVFAFGMGQIFLVLGMLGQTKILPRSGPWMNFVKFIFGCAMFALALFYIRPIVLPSAFNILVGLLMVYVSIYHNTFSKPEAWSKKIVLIKAFLVGLFVFGFAMALQGLFPKQFQDLGLSKKVSESPMEWEVYSEEKLEAAIAAKKAVIIDFNAEWCVACKEMEMFTFVDEGVVTLGREFVLLKFDATRTSPELRRLQSRYGVTGLPWFVFYDSKGTYREDLTLPGFEDAVSFKLRMEQALYP